MLGLRFCSATRGTRRHRRHCVQQVRTLLIKSLSPFCSFVVVQLCLSVCLSICLSVCLCIYVCLCHSVCLSVCLSVSLPLSFPSSYPLVSPFPPLFDLCVSLCLSLPLLVSLSMKPPYPNQTRKKITSSVKLDLPSGKLVFELTPNHLRFSAARLQGDRLANTKNAALSRTSRLPHFCLVLNTTSHLYFIICLHLTPNCCLYPS